VAIGKSPLEDMDINLSTFYANKRVFITGHTGFKGSWLSLWLNTFGAQVIGYSLEPPTEPSLFKICRINELVNSIKGDIRDLKYLQQVMVEASPDIVIHMAAQALVRDSYLMPVETFATNVMGTVNVLEAVAHTPTVRAVVIVTTDKCYENREAIWGYRENDALGGYDPYSSSKACAELVTGAYRNSFFKPAGLSDRKPTTLTTTSSVSPCVASARAGNVIGGGDWARDRLVPDCIRSIMKGEKSVIRNPSAIRPWQHVMDPLAGYLILAQRLYVDGHEYTGPWNFGPNDEDARPVSWIVDRFSQVFPDFCCECSDTPQPHEAHFLKLDSSKARYYLGWQPRWRLVTAIHKTLRWYEAWLRAEDMRAVTFQQIIEYQQEKEVT
jgi:CDP-glucose 4,6-dehydratase